MSLLGLDLAQKALSLYTVTAFVMAVLPNVYAIMLSGPRYDNCNPRKLQSTITADDKLDEITKARILRAKAASENIFETLGFYSAVVVAANLTGVDAHAVNIMTLSYIGCRALYNIVYVRLEDNRN
ncbi:uncharacterized protein GLRG_00138 [Colletotrichum graminicola M1.001]|uniref:Uncharacterized protein n=1 Tax=Colletotrichum graminicola (strain M1.001 / M2 / FGSC 10212) TaxID=645133 RepID=E3Q315_COLGM|nr:uncharacterized protein GLRG_00138 [Colletotrichum graminicola M1.001]EFQ24994.1 hypothetical protein GLRG_00138 [Colletotrichum graminicola M1.001]